MQEYRTTTELNPETEHTFVEMGPIPDLPAWHQQAQPSRFPFPTKEAALRFARTHSERDPGRKVVIAYPDGRRWDGKAWVV